MRRLQAWFIGCLCLGFAVCLPAMAQAKLDKGQLDQLPVSYTHLTLPTTPYV